MRINYSMGAINRLYRLKGLLRNETQEDKKRKGYPDCKDIPDLFFPFIFPGRGTHIAINIICCFISI